MTFALPAFQSRRQLHGGRPVGAFYVNSGARAETGIGATTAAACLATLNFIPASARRMFLPVKPDFRLPRFPLLTTAVCVICALVFANQQLDWHEYRAAVDRYCEAPRSHIERMVIHEIHEANQLSYCDDIPYLLVNAPNEAEAIEVLISGMQPLTGFNAEDSRDYVTQLVRDDLRLYRQTVPPDPDQGLAYYADSWNPWHMLTASFAHGDWGHIVFNLIFFVAFGTLVEMLVGGLSFIALIVVISLITGVFTSVSALASGANVASLGLSGVVMGMIGLSAYLLPRGRIRCYYWFIVLFGSVAIPVWLLALWYIGGDVYALFAYEDHGVINVMAHVTGGLGGYLFGLLFMKRAKIEAEGVQMTIDRAVLRPKF